MPGDYVKIDGEQVVTVAATKTGTHADEVNAWVFLLNEAGKYVEAKEITTGTPVEFTIDLGVTSSNLGVANGEGYQQVSTALTEANAGDEIASFEIGSYTVKAIQKENLATAAAAAEALGIEAA